MLVLAPGKCAQHIDSDYLCAVVVCKLSTISWIISVVATKSIALPVLDCLLQRTSRKGTLLVRILGHFSLVTKVGL